MKTENRCHGRDSDNWFRFDKYVIRVFVSSDIRSYYMDFLLSQYTENISPGPCN